MLAIKELQIWKVIVQILSLMVYNGWVLQYCIVYRQVQNLNVTNKFITNDNVKWLDIYVVRFEDESDHKGIIKVFI